MTKAELMRAIAKETGYTPARSIIPFRNSKPKRATLHHPTRVHDRYRAHSHRNGCCRN